MKSEYMGDNVRHKLKKCGKDVIIHPLAKILNPENVEIGDHSQIDDFTFINGGKSTIIGSYVHIASFVSIIGGGELIIGDFSGVSAGCRIITGSDDFTGKSLVSPCIPDKFKPHLHQGKITMGKHTILGTNTIVHTGVNIGEGTVTGSNTLVNHNLLPWGIYVGSPARRLKEREKNLLELEKKFMREIEVIEKSKAVEKANGCDTCLWRYGMKEPKNYDADKCEKSKCPFRDYF